MTKLDWQDFNGVNIDSSGVDDLAEQAIAHCRRMGEHGQACVSTGNRLVFAREDYGKILVLECVVKRRASTT